MFLTNQPHTIFPSAAAAHAICVDMDESEYKVLEDPKGSGRCIVAMLDEVDGSQIGYL